MMNTIAKIFLPIALSFSCGFAFAAPPTQPGAPEGRVTESVVSLSWKASVDDGSVGGYNVYLNDAYLTTVLTPEYSGELDTSSDNMFYIVAFDNENPPQFSPRSESLKISSSDGGKQDAPPSTPLQPRLVEATATSISITWDDASDDVGVIGYNVYRNRNYLTTVFDTKFTDEDLPSSDSVNYSIVAFDRVPNYTPQSPDLTVAIPSDDTGLVDTEAPSLPASLSAEVFENSLLLSWAASTDNVGVVGYNIYKNGTYIATVNDTTFLDENVPSDASVSYSVVAFDEARNFTPLSAELIVALNETPTPEMPDPEMPDPEMPDPEMPDTDGDGISDQDELSQGLDANNADTDGDGVPDGVDQFPNDSTASVDTDGDGVSDDRDEFPNDPTETSDLNEDGLGDNANPFDGTVISGVVTDEQTDMVIPNATVALELINTSSVTNPVVVTSTNAVGEFTLIAQEQLLPSSFVLIITANGYKPATATLSTDSGELVTSVPLSVMANDFVVIEQVPSVHHLGDDSFSGTFNSQFQRSTEGPTLTRNINLTTEQAESSSLLLVWVAKGIQNQNTVSINGEIVGTTPDSNADGSYTDQAIELQVEGILQAGANTITIDSVASGISNDIDDFEFVFLGLGVE